MIDLIKETEAANAESINSRLRTIEANFKRLGELVIPEQYNNAGVHNSIYRGKNLGTSVTPEQYEACRKGTFEDLFIGDYWTINGTTYQIACFNYFYNTGDIACKTNHINVMPSDRMYDQRMNATDTTEGGYMGSEMYQTGLNQAKATINKDFGAEHILSHRLRLSNSVVNGKVNSGAWANSTVELPTEEMMYGGNIYTAHPDGTNVPVAMKVGKAQLPLFTFRPDLISNRNSFWLQNVVSSTEFAAVGFYGYSSLDEATYADVDGVRPVFSIH